MFERYTEAARRTIFFAREEANQRVSAFIEPEHFLLGLLRESRDVLAGFLKEEAKVDAIRRELEKASPLLGSQLPNPDIPLSHPVKRVLAYGAEEAERMHHRRIGIEHHVLGLLREPSAAAHIFEKHGVTIESGRAYVRQHWKDDVPSRKPGREGLHGLIDTLPVDAVPQAFVVLQQLQSWRRAHLPVDQEGISIQVSTAQRQSQHSSSSRMEGDTLVVESRFLLRSHEITKIERLNLSDDGKTLHYATEIHAPKQKHEFSDDFDLS